MDDGRLLVFGLLAGASALGFSALGSSVRLGPLFPPVEQRRWIRPFHWRTLTSSPKPKGKDTRITVLIQEFPEPSLPEAQRILPRELADLALAVPGDGDPDPSNATTGGGYHPETTDPYFRETAVAIRATDGTIVVFTGRLSHSGYGGVSTRAIYEAAGLGSGYADFDLRFDRAYVSQKGQWLIREADAVVAAHPHERKKDQGSKIKAPSFHPSSFHPSSGSRVRLGPLLTSEPIRYKVEMTFTSGAKANAHSGALERMIAKVKGVTDIDVTFLDYVEGESDTVGVSFFAPESALVPITVSIEAWLAKKNAFWSGMVERDR